MRTLGFLVVTLTIAGGGVLRAADSGEPSEDRINQIIQKFAAREAEFAQARENYTYRQTARVQSLDDAGGSTGKWEMVSDITFSQDGKRTEHVVFSPVSTLTAFFLSPEDMEDLRSVQPFVLTTKDLPKYVIRYLGRQKVDEIGCYVFEVEPRKLEKDQRYFQGKIWVDDRDFQIVKTYGKAVPDIVGKNKDNLFPRFETYREQIDKKYWFPTYTRAVDTLNFQTGPQKIRQIIKYQNYKQFGANIQLIFGDAVDENGKPIAPVDNKAPAIGPSDKAPATGPKK
jgi:hypothetical protein